MGHFLIPLLKTLSYLFHIINFYFSLIVENKKNLIYNKTSGGEILEENIENSKKYLIKIENFEGPLDLLCFLIDKNKMDIFDIKLDEITEQYI